MRYTKKTEYGLMCMIYMAKQADGSRPIAIKDIADEEHYPVPFIEKILQALKKAGLVRSKPGKQGGYVLARKAADICLRDIIVALEGATFDTFCAPARKGSVVCNHYCLCGIKPVWRKTKKLLDDFFMAITLDKLIGNELENFWGQSSLTQ